MIHLDMDMDMEVTPILMVVSVILTMATEECTVTITDILVITAVIMVAVITVSAVVTMVG